MKAIIFGANGQDGYYLSKLLLKKGIQVIGVSRSVNFLHTDITKFKEVSELIKINQPQFIFHLAAYSTTNHIAWKENHDTISSGSLNILESVKQFSPLTKVFLSGSGLQFHNRGTPINESHPFEATSMYAVSRIHSVYAARFYRSLGVKAYVGYFFNHDSPMRAAKHLSRQITDAVKRIATGSKEKIPIGDLAVRKEYGYAEDIMKGILVLLGQEEIWEAVIGTGEAFTIEEWIASCFSVHGLSWKDYVVPINNFKSEYRTLVSDPTTIKSLGWKPETSMKELAKMMSTLS